MAPRSRSWQAVIAALAACAAGCLQSPSRTSPQVFVGSYPDDVNFQPFINTAADVAPDASTCFPETTLYCPDGGSSLKVTVPGPGKITNQYAGGAFVAALPRNLSGYDGVAFWAKATRQAPFVVGLGNDNSGSSRYPAEWNETLNTTWTQYILPIPLPVKLNAEKGLLYFAAGAVGSPATGFTFWLANIQYVQLGSAIGNPTPVLAPACVQRAVGNVALAFPGTTGGTIPVTFAVNAANVFTVAANRYFTFSSSDPTVATVDVSGMVTIQGPGIATVTAQLGGFEGAGPLTVKVNTKDPCPPLAAPTTAAPKPTVPKANVISLYNSSGTYTNVPVSQWHTSWSLCCSDVKDTTITTPSRPAVVKQYNLHAFAGIGFGPDGTSINEIDASQMTFFHADVWTPNGFAFQVQLVNDPTGYASNSTVQIDASSTPPLQTGTWVGMEIPMTAFWNLGGTSKLGQMLFLVPAGTTGLFYVDNIYFHN